MYLEKMISLLKDTSKIKVVLLVPSLIFQGKEENKNFEIKLTKFLNNNSKIFPKLKEINDRIGSKVEIWNQKRFHDF